MNLPPPTTGFDFDVSTGRGFRAVARVTAANGIADRSDLRAFGFSHVEELLPRGRRFWFEVMEMNDQANGTTRVRLRRGHVLTLDTVREMEFSR